MANRMAVHYLSIRSTWSTPKALFDKLNAEFDFTLDVCASPENAKCEKYFTEKENALLQPRVGTCWMNPPYGREISQWMERAWRQSELNRAVVVCLVPARTDTNWWHNYAMKGEIRFIRGRLCFNDGEGRAPFPSAIVIFRPTGNMQSNIT